MTTWDAYQFWSKYYDFWNKVVELHYIDAALDAIEAAPAHYGGPGGGRFEFKLGSTYPFEKAGTMPLSAKDGVETAIADAVTAAESWGETLFSGMDTKLAPVTRPDLDTAGAEYGPRSRIDTAATGVRVVGNDSDIGDLGTLLSDWEGSAYDQFMVFHSRVTTAASNQADFGSVIGAYLETACGIVRAGQLAVLDGITSLEAAADDQLAKRAADNRSDVSVVDFLTLASLATGAAGLIPGPQAILLGGASLAFSVAATAIPEEASEPVNVEVNTAEQLGAEFTTGIGGAVESVHHLHDALGDKCAELDTLIQGEWPHRMYPPQPGIDETTGTPGFHRT